MFFNLPFLRSFFLRTHFFAGEKFQKITSENMKELRRNISSMENLTKNFTLLQEAINDLNSVSKFIL